MSTRPLLRPLDFQPVIYQGQQMWLLRDPLTLTDNQLIFPPALAQMLTLLDGTRDAQEIHTAFCRQIGATVDFEVVAETLAQLDAALLLDNERAQAAMADLLAAYRAQPFRRPALAGTGYPEDPAGLTAYLDRLAGDDDPGGGHDWSGRAIVSPHIDYQRGGPVYASVWRRAEAAVAEADLVLIFGTDHNGGLGSVTLTRQPYATPYGVLPAATELVDSLAAAVGPEQAFAYELNHREEHSVELSAVWLHYVYRRLGQDPAPMVPLLCGSFQHFLGTDHHPAGDDRLNALIDTLKRDTAGENVLAVASVDLAHVGPSFGDPFPMDADRRQHLRTSDERLIAAINSGDHALFYDEIAAVEDRNRICGFSSTYLMLRYLDDTPVCGTEIAYDHCPADADNTSLVSICGLLLD